VINNLLRPIFFLTATSRGALDLNGANSLRSDAELISQLRALPGVGLSWNRPW
jgi:hypothetical protein